MSSINSGQRIRSTSSDKASRSKGYEALQGNRSDVKSAGSDTTELIQAESRAAASYHSNMNSNSNSNTNGHNDINMTPAERKALAYSSNMSSSTTGLSEIEARFLGRTNTMAANSSDGNMSQDYFDDSFTLGGDLNQLAQMSFLANGTSELPRKGSASSSSKRIAELESQVNGLRSSANDMITDLNTKNESIEKLLTQLEKGKKKSFDDLIKLKNEHEVEVIRLQQLHALDKATVLKKADTNGYNANFTKPPSRGGSSPSEDEMSQCNASEVSFHLIKQIEALRTELQNLHESFAAERRSMNHSFADRLTHQERQLKTEAMEIVAQKAQAEDLFANTKDELNRANSMVKMLEGANVQLEVMKDDALKAQTSLRNDMKNLQASIHASKRVNGSAAQVREEASDGPSAETQTAVRLTEAKYEAKMRQSNNKIEFLKSQLDSEKKTGDEIKDEVATSRQKLDMVREEFKWKMQEMERSKVNAIEEVEQRLEAYYSGQMTELTTIQTKVKNLTGQLEDAQSGETFTRAREEKLKTTISKNMAHAAALKMEIEDLRKQLHEVGLEREKEQSQNAGKPNSEVTIRRLDNERKYLKSQLASEVTHKNEVTDALQKAQSKLQEVQDQWNEDVDTLKKQGRDQERDILELSTQSQQTEQRLQSDLNSAQSYNQELREALTKIRDQVRMEQLSVETLKTTNRRAKENLDAANDDIERLKALSEQDKAYFNSQVEMMKLTLTDLENRKQKELGILKDELNEQCLQTSQTQAYLVVSKEETMQERHRLVQQDKLSNMYRVMQKWRSSRVNTFFRIWNTSTILMQVASQFRKQIEYLLQKNVDEMNAEKMRALDTLQQSMLREFADRESHLNKLHEERVLEIVRIEQENYQKALANAQSDFKAQLEQVEADFAYDLTVLETKSKEHLRMKIEAKNRQIEKIEENHRAHVTRLGEEAAKSQAEAVASKELEMTDLMNQNLKEQDERLTGKYERIMRDAKADYEEAMRNQQNDYQQQLADQKFKAEATLKAAMEKAKAMHAHHIETLTSDMNTQKAYEIKCVLAEQEEHLQQCLLLQHQNTEIRVNELLLMLQGELDSNLNQKQKEFDELLLNRMDQYARDQELEKQRAIKLEASKWRQVFKDTQTNHQLELYKVRAEVCDSKDQEMKHEIDKSNALNDIRRAEEASAFNARMEDMKTNNGRDMEKQRKAHAALMEKTCKELEERVTQEQSTLWFEKMRQMTEELELKCGKKLAKEQRLIEELRKELNQMVAAHADERNKLQKEINGGQARLKLVEDKHRAELEELERKWEDEKENMTNNGEDRMQAALKKFEADKKQSILETIEKEQAAYDKLLNKEMDKLRRENQIQMALMQEETEKLISGLESALEGLKEEKDKLVEELGLLRTNFENKEDEIYDLESSLKAEQKKSSYTLWTSAVKIFQIKERFRKGILEFDKEAEKRYQTLKKEMQLSVNEAILTALKLAALLHFVEVERRKTHGVLCSYKAEDLIENRYRIQMVEKELDRLTLEKDSLDDQKLEVQGEIDLHEQQVRELEDQIREHNRESSMTNGRINVAHARKKRRLDGELERLLETIDQKRISMMKMDQLAGEKALLKDEKIADMIDIEKKIVGLLVEQQRIVLSQVEDAKGFEDKTRLQLTMSELPWPTPTNPGVEHVAAILKKREADNEQKAVDDAVKDQEGKRAKSAVDELL